MVKFRFAWCVEKGKGWVRVACVEVLRPSNSKAATVLAEELVPLWQTLIYSTLNSRRSGRISNTPLVGNFLANIWFFVLKFSSWQHPWTEAVQTIQDFWIVTPWIWACISRRFGGLLCLNFQRHVVPEQLKVTVLRFFETSANTRPTTWRHIQKIWIAATNSNIVSSFDICVTVHHCYSNINNQLDATITVY